MYRLHSVATPNGHKVSIMMAELALSYDLVEYDITKGDQFKPEFLALNPNNKLPVLEDLETGAVVAESGAILIYLAEKHANLLSTEPLRRAKTLQWLMFQMSAVGPLQGQAHHYVRYARVKQDYAQTRYLNETKRQCQVLQTVLQERDYLADEYSIADIACWPWIRALPLIDIHIHTEYPALAAWFDRIAAREAVQAGKDVINGWVYELPPNFFMELDENTWSYSFGEEQYRRRI